MLHTGDALLVGVSGGPDSVALLYILIGMAEHYGYRIGIAHLDHGIRGAESERDAKFVESLAKKHALPYYLDTVDLIAERKKSGMCLEEAGREVRYRFFHHIADRFGYDRIAVGHHRGDDAELIMMNLLRGSGPAGICGMRPAGQRVIRPLIAANRKEILSFLHSRQIAYVHDRTNDETIYRRNRIRHHLIPALSQYNPRIVETLSRLGEVLRTEEEWLDSLIGPMLEQVVRHREPNRMVIDLEGLGRIPLAARRRVLRRVIAEVKGDLRRIGFVHIDAILGLSNSGKERGALDLPDRLRAVLNGSRLILRKEKKPLRSSDLSGTTLLSSPFEYQVPCEETETVRLWIAEIDAWMVMERLPREKYPPIPSRDAAVMDWDRLVFPLNVRTIRPGDRFVPLGMRGTQKLKDFFINNKVPKAERGRIPLVVSGDRVVWIAGFRIDERVKVSESTQTVLKTTLIPANSQNTITRAEDFQFERF